MADTSYQKYEGAPAPKRFTASFLIGAIVVTAFISFVAGTRGNELFAVVAPHIGMTAPGSFDDDVTQEVYRVLKQNYDGKLDNHTLAESAAKGLVAGAGDDYTTYMTADEAQKYQDGLSGKIGGGIGAEIGKRGGKTVIVRAIKDTPAQRAGVQAGDVILGVNDEVASEWTVDETVQKIRGDVGSSVKVTVERDGEPKEFKIVRAEITSPDVEFETKGDTGVIRVSRFDKDTGTKVRAHAEEIKKSGLKSVVLDLRGNGGGYLEAGVDVASVWLNDKVVVSERKGGEITEELKSKGSPILEGIPTVVLIDAASASASEIVAGALKDHGAATLVGEKTFGKGSVQSLISLSTGGQLKVTIARWFTPNGKNITKEGIEADEKVALTAEDVNKGRDPQLDAALKQLRK